MKILIVNMSDINGGAARAAYRLHTSLLAKKIDSKMLVMNKTGQNYSVLTSISNVDKVINKLRPHIDSIPLRFYKNKTQASFSVSSIYSKKIIAEINNYGADIVHLHWINAGMIRIEEIKNIKAKVVWTLHDMWPFTGGCHYDQGCGRYKYNCGSCPVLNSDLSEDLSFKTLQRKKNSYPKINNLTVVGVSEWLTNCAKESYLFKDLNNIKIPNPLDTNVFKSLNEHYSRDLWALPKNKKLILFGAIGSTKDKRKGFNELRMSLKLIERDDIVCVVFGADKPENEIDFGHQVIYVGTLSDDISLVSLYNSVDVMVVPSLQEAFGQTASEAMACGTPVVAFKHTGLVDIVDHKINGYLAEPLDITDFARGIEWVIDNNKYKDLCNNAREKVVRNFDNNIVADQFINLYQKLLK